MIIEKRKITDFQAVVVREICKNNMIGTMQYLVENFLMESLPKNMLVGCVLMRSTGKFILKIYGYVAKIFFAMFIAFAGRCYE